MPFPIGAAMSAPGIFTQDSSGRGQAAARNQDGSTNSAANPAKAGEVITLFATGLGRPGLAVSVTIGGQSVIPISVDRSSQGVAK
jgi:uncharacterized protein (TIGR03437 family)